MCPPDGSGLFGSAADSICEETHFTVVHHVGEAFPKAAKNINPREFMNQKGELISLVLGMPYPEGLDAPEKARIRGQRIHAVNTYYPYNPLIHYS